MKAPTPRPYAQDTAVAPSPARRMRRLIGWTIVLVGLMVLGHDAARSLLFDDERVRSALLGGLIAAGATALGTVPVMFSRTLSDRVQDTLLGFGAGVMLAACSFSLIVPGVAAATAQGAGPWHAASIVGGGILLGAFLIYAIDRYVPHEHFIKGIEGVPNLRLRRTWLFVIAIALHNIPEGLAIGAGFGGTDALRASALATGIAIQDVPEGLVVAVALLSAGYSRAFAVTLGAASGLVEPIGAVIGASVIGMSAALLPWGLAFAAGAMLFVISHEMIPESHRKGHEAFATGGLMIGFVLMMTLDTALG
ncbi:MAG: ZIP family metal transporter [Rhodocyclaceae bacterium]